MLVASQEPNSSQEPKEASAVSSIGWALGPAIPPVVDLVAHQQTSDSEAQIYIYTFPGIPAHSVGMDSVILFATCFFETPKTQHSLPKPNPPTKVPP